MSIEKAIFRYFGFAPDKKIAEAGPNAFFFHFSRRGRRYTSLKNYFEYGRNLRINLRGKDEVVIALFPMSKSRRKRQGRTSPRAVKRRCSLLGD